MASSAALAVLLVLAGAVQFPAVGGARGLLEGRGACRDGCPNVVDLYATVAAAEGMSVPVLCEAQNKLAGNRRMLTGTMPPAPLGALAAGAPAVYFFATEGVPAGAPAS